MNVSQWLKNASLELAEFDSARLDADLLLCHVLQCERATLYAWPEKNLSAAQLSELGALLDKRKLGHPVAYLTEHHEFWSLEFDINEHVLVPRPETELIVGLALQAMPIDDSNPILDAGTGSGIIATAVMHEWQSDGANNDSATQRIIASDTSSTALALARRNAHKHVPGCISFVRSNWLDAFADDTLGMIISNPPYIAGNDSHLSSKTLQFEPKAALVSGADGLDAIRTLVNDACRAGISGCYLLLEHGATQADEVCALMHQANYTNIQTHDDFAGLNRVSCGYCP